MRQHSSVTKKLALALALTALYLPAGAQETAPKTEKRPQAVAAEPVVELGDVTYGDTRTHDFVIRNTGDDVLRIHAANSNCACTVLEFTPEIAPGGVGKVTARFDAQLEGGAVAIPIEAITNDPDSPQLLLTIKAFVRYFILADPGFFRYVIVQDFDGDSTVSQTLWSTDGKPMKITKVESPYDFVEVTFREARAEELEKKAPSQQQWKVEARISPKAPVGPLTGFVTVHIDHPTQKLAKLPLHGFVRPMFAVTPPAADWGRLTMVEQGLMTSLKVMNFAEELVKVTGAETSVAGITAAVEEVDPGRIYYVKLTYAPTLPKGKFDGVVRIKTESPKKPLIEVPLKGSIS
jgi:hypothetical protein